MFLPIYILAIVECAYNLEYTFSIQLVSVYDQRAHQHEGYHVNSNQKCNCECCVTIRAEFE